MSREPPHSKSHWTTFQSFFTGEVTDERHASELFKEPRILPIRLPKMKAAQLASALSDSSSLQVYPRSISCARNAVFFLGARVRTSRSGLFRPIRPAGRISTRLSWDHRKRSILTGIL